MGPYFESWSLSIYAKRLQETVCVHFKKTKTLTCCDDDHYGDNNGGYEPLYSNIVTVYTPIKSLVLIF